MLVHRYTSIHTQPLANLDTEDKEHQKRNGVHLAILMLMIMLLNNNTAICVQNETLVD